MLIRHILGSSSYRWLTIGVPVIEFWDSFKNKHLETKMSFLKLKMTKEKENSLKVFIEINII